MDADGFDFDLNLVLIGAVLALIGAVFGAAAGWLRHGRSGVGRSAAMGAFALPVVALFGVYIGGAILALVAVGLFGVLLG